MDLSSAFVSQRKLRNPQQISAMSSAIAEGDLLPPILLSQDEDGSIQIEDGHHRAVAYLLSGRTSLLPHEYVVLPRERLRPRFGLLGDLLSRIGMDI